MPHAALLAVDGYRAITKEQQAQKISPVERQVIDLLLADHLSHGGALTVCLDGRRFDVHGLAHFADLQIHIDTDHLIHVELDVGSGGRAEARLVDLDGIYAHG